MPDLPTSPLRLRRQLTHAPSSAVAAVVERVRLDLIAKGYTEERAAWWAARVAHTPELRYLYAGGGG